MFSRYLRNVMPPHSENAYQFHLPIKLRLVSSVKNFFPIRELCIHNNSDNNSDNNKQNLSSKHSHFVNLYDNRLMLSQNSANVGINSKNTAGCHLNLFILSEEITYEAAIHWPLLASI